MLVKNSMIHVKFHPEVKEDLAEAVCYYEKEEMGCGEKFLIEYDNTLQKIFKHSGVYRRFYHESRRLNLVRFPFAIVYECSGQSIYIKAVAALRKKPYFWRER